MKVLLPLQLFATLCKPRLIQAIRFLVWFVITCLFFFDIAVLTWNYEKPMIAFGTVVVLIYLVFGARIRAIWMKACEMAQVLQQLADDDFTGY